MTASPLPPTQSSPLLFVSSAVALALLLTWGPNLFLASYALAVLLAALLLLWRPGQSSVMLLVIGLQWLQASVKLFNANLIGQPIGDMAALGGDIVTSISLSLTGLLALAVGLRFGSGPGHGIAVTQAKSVALAHPVLTWFRWYVIALVISAVAQQLSYEVTALAQPLLALANLKWGFFFILTFAVFSRPRQGRGVWLLAFGTELALATGSFFADFRSVFLFTILGLAAAGVRLTAGRVMLLSAVGILAVCSAIVWTAVKGQYRGFVNAGLESQAVLENYVDRINYLAHLVGDLDGIGFRQGAEEFLDRLSYVDIFGAVVNYVPSSVAHTQGEIWLDAVARPFMPRAFFPDKTVIDDSARTSEFTGLDVAGGERGTSISIGYMGESYIDFGPIGMMVPILVLGYSLGRVHRWLVVAGPMQGLLGMGVGSATLMAFSFLESSITKVFGGFVAALLVIYLMSRFVVPRYLAWMAPASNSRVPLDRYPPAMH